jgi:hypothetical protein
MSSNEIILLKMILKSLRNIEEAVCSKKKEDKNRI